MMLYGIALFFLSGFFTLFTSSKGLNFAIITAIAAAMVVPASIAVIYHGAEWSVTAHFGYPMGDVPLRLDPLAAFFLLLIAISAVFTAFFSAGYMKMYQRSRYSLGGYYCALGILAATMLLVVVVQNALAFLIVWELMSFSSFFLVSFEHESPQVRRAGLYYLVAMQVGAAFLVAAFAWMHQAVSSLDFADFGAVVPTSGMVLFLLFFVGFGTKAGFIPLHSWLPLAHPAAPSPVSAMMSGVMIKTGIYGILRMVMVLPPQGMVMAYAVLLVSLFTGLYGIMNALVQSDMKKMLAYSSIENIGIIGMGIGMAMLGRCYQMPGLIIAGYGAALLHLLNHFLFKSLLFWGAGALYTRTHTRDVESMGGLIHLMPITSLLFLVGTLGICGFPLFAGFVSEFILYWGFATHLNGASLGLTLALLGGLTGLSFIGVLALAGFSRIYGVAFLGANRGSGPASKRDACGFMLVPMAVSAALIILVGVASPLLLPLLQPVISTLAPEITASAVSALQPLLQLLSSGLGYFAAMLILVAFLYRILMKNKKRQTGPTWGCGYQGATAKMQYSAASFIAPLQKLLSGVVPAKTTLFEPTQLFPRESSCQSAPYDVLQHRLVEPLNRLIAAFLRIFAGVQSGRTQQYILYGLIALVILIVTILGVR